MTRSITHFVSLLALSAAPALAQTKASPAPTIEKRLLGKWEGTFRSDHAGGQMQLHIARDSTWKVTLSMQTDLHPIPDQQVSAFKVEGNNITWAAELMGGICRSAAVLEGAEIKGETTCDQVHFSFVLKKK